MNLKKWMRGDFAGYKDFAKAGFLFAALTTLLLGGVMFSYIYASPAIGLMTAEGWIYLAVAALGHAACFALAAYILFLVVGLTGLRRPAVWLMVLLCALMVVFMILNRQVYAIYRFHINGFILNMVTGPGAGGIFVLDSWMIVKECALLALFAGATVGLWFAATRISRSCCGGRAVVWSSLLMALFIPAAHLYHAYGAFVRHAAVTRAAVSLPYFYPLTAKSLLTKLGVKAPESVAGDEMELADGEVCYPAAPLAVHQPDSLPDIYLILLDSWNPRGFTEETMPNAWRFGMENTRFTRHMSSSNGTRCSVFGIFYGVPGYYWESFEAAGVTPPLISRLLQLGYDVQAYPAANLLNPDFRHTVFRQVENLNEGEECATVWQSDRSLTDRFLADMQTAQGDEDNTPRFSFLFYDLPHAIALPPERNVHFKPAWDFADYTRLDNDLDPTEFWNLYRNCLREDDNMLGEVLEAIANRERLTGRPALVILSGDHGQEFNENHHNYWGHSGNYSNAQIMVPLVVRFPGGAHSGETFAHRTTHYDFVPTLMARFLGVENDAADYSIGHDLIEGVSGREWHISGSNLNYAFITPGDTILEKGGMGELTVYDPRMNLVDGYRINPAEMRVALDRLNRFIK